MPNLTPPVTTAKLACEYRARIMAHVPEVRPGPATLSASDQANSLLFFILHLYYPSPPAKPNKGSSFEPLMTLYLTDNTPAEEVHRAKEAGVRAFKLYPAGATTNSDSGVTDVRKCFGALKAMEETGTLLLVHGEVVDPKIDIFDRERVFIETVLPTILDNFPNLKVVLEHITTKHAARFVLDGPKNVAASVTPQHMLLNRNALLVGGIKPHFYCLPILKREEHRLAIVEAATSGHPRFFLGTDSAPHELLSKHTACGCAGVFSAHAALELYATVFERAGALDKLEAFAAFNGPDFYGLPRNTTRVTLERTTWTTPADYPFKGGRLVPILAGEDLAWKLRDDDAVPVPGSFCARCPPPPPSDSDPPPKKPKT